MRMPRSRAVGAPRFDITREHPLLGIGPDNFRHVYGRYLGLAAWDTRVHANNMYLEVLVGMGVVGVAALLLARRAARARQCGADRAPARVRSPLLAATAAAWLAIAGHGLVDTFLTFTTTYVMFALPQACCSAPWRLRIYAPWPRRPQCGSRLTARR